MDSKIIELLSEEIRETRNLTLAVVKETERLERHVEAAERKADAAWEVVIMTREEIRAREETKKPFWKKLFG